MRYIINHHRTNVNSGGNIEFFIEEVDAERFYRKFIALCNVIIIVNMKKYW